MNCEEAEELIGAHALRALTPEDAANVERHLASCAKHGDVPELRAAAQSLMLTAPDAEPPARLKARLMDAVRRDLEAASASRARPGLVGWFKGIPALRAGSALAGAFAAAGVTIIALALLLPGGGQNDVIVADLRGSSTASGQVVYVPEDRTVAISAEGLPELPPNMTYQIWVLRDGLPTSLGFLEGDEERAQFGAEDVDLDDADTVAITIEPAGGSPTPTTQPILQAQL